MENMRSSKLSLFLMELIVAIMFFSLSAAVCIRLFAAAHVLAEKTGNLESAIMWSQNLSEAFTAKKGDLEKIAALYPDSYIASDSDDAGSLIIIFDKDWEPTDRDLADASYEVILSAATKDASEVYSDITDYDVELAGKAVTGEIAIIDLRGGKEVLSVIPEDKDKIFYSNSIDVYIGKEDE